MWVWFLHTSELRPQQTAEIVNSQAFEVEHVVEETLGNLTWGQAKFKSTVTHDWNLASFPLAKQVLVITFEDAKTDITVVR